jgi:phosphoribosylformylglycinamidine cyclo-ligase
LAASCTGIIQPKQRLSLGDELQAGDAIVILASSGIHANGLSLARKLAERLPQGYLTPVAGSDQIYGEALLAPTTLYSPVTEALWKAGVNVHYSINVTGHGWRKLLRHTKALTYRISQLPPVPPVLQFIQQQAQHSAQEAYSTLNMGAGFALFVRPQDAQQTVQVAKAQGIDAWVCGQVEAGPKRLLIEPIDVEFGLDDLQLR